MARKKVTKLKSLSQGRPPTIKPLRSGSSKATRTLIRTYHTLEKQKAKAVADGDEVKAAVIAEQIELQGGIESYQRASLTGQTSERGGDSSKILMEWLEPVISVLRDHEMKGQPARLLEIGALSVGNACSRSRLFEVERIDLNSQAEGIKQQDFMQRPVPLDDMEQFDIISLSLVLNYVPDPVGRGEMLLRTLKFLRTTTPSDGLGEYLPSLFLVLPAPCVVNSRYLDEVKLESIMKSLGYAQIKKKLSHKIVYYLWRMESVKPLQTTPFKKDELRSGGSRNNFAIVLRGGQRLSWKTYSRYWMPGPIWDLLLLIMFGQVKSRPGIAQVLTKVESRDRHNGIPWSEHAQLVLGELTAVPPYLYTGIFLGTLWIFLSASSDRSKFDPRNLYVPTPPTDAEPFNVGKVFAFSDTSQVRDSVCCPPISEESLATHDISQPIARSNSCPQRALLPANEEDGRTVVTSTMTSRNPTNWDEYEYGTSPDRGSIGSAAGRSVRFGEHEEDETSALLETPGRQGSENNQQGELRRRRSSIGLRLNSLAQVGGVNSIENFARSWTRAAGFPEVTPHRPSFILDQDWAFEDTLDYGRTDAEYGQLPRTSLIRAHLEEHGSPEDAVDDESILPESHPTTSCPLNPKEAERMRLGTSVQGSIRGSPPMFATPPHLATPLSGAVGTSYGTIRSSLSESSMVHAGQLWKKQQAKQMLRAEGGREPILVKEVEQDGKIVLAVAGQSTLPQTIFNSTNVLIGVGLLSLPMGIRYSGWICGMLFLAFSALVTAYTATVLTKCMDVDAGLITFADLAYVSYGQKARIATSVLFTMELLAACVALVVLFADTLDLLIPGVGVNQWKILCGILLIPLNFTPLRLLSFSSVLGIFSCFCIVSIVFIDGFYKPHTPGSLREPAKTYLFPSNWLTLPLSFGLLMSPWGGHSVFPNIYRDMRHPHKFKRAVKVTFTFTYVLDCATMVSGILMFGDGIMTEITANLLNTPGYPRVLSIIMSIFIAIIPLTKVPLNARPIVSTIEVFSGLDNLSVSDSPALTGLSGYTRGILKIFIRILVVVIFVLIAIIFPAFDSIMAFMGSTLCFTICVILPLLFYLKIFGKEIPLRERILDYVLIAVCSVMATVGTIWAFLPKSLIGAE